jgi:hypothetical protein
MAAVAEVRLHRVRRLSRQTELRDLVGPAAAVADPTSVSVKVVGGGSCTMTFMKQRLSIPHFRPKPRRLLSQRSSGARDGAACCPSRA